ncbi:hypothetical protein DPEC_G00198320 [Dallia pectoralis]|uniref:Uncharacterized protein n=1 Tax=Dallia pectoralis TaxID=75939 RepID=A0ACC2G847_DALPE|nr:hypothetical protein DPEC_G00198320 [Dallia pectoralis]
MPKEGSVSHRMSVTMNCITLVPGSPLELERSIKAHLLLERAGLASHHTVALVPTLLLGIGALTHPTHPPLTLMMATDVALLASKAPPAQDRKRERGGGRRRGGGVTQQILSNAAMALDGWWPLEEASRHAAVGGGASEREKRRAGELGGGCDSMGSH